MKKLFFTAAVSAAIFLISCEKQDENEKECPVVAADAVPQAVKDSFNIRYPATAVIKWFNKDNTGFCAYFKASDIQKLAQFDGTGIFIKEEREAHQNGQHEDKAATVGKNTVGCECETDD